jgi:signal transduction histidine kinase
MIETSHDMQRLRERLLEKTAPDQPADGDELPVGVFCRSVLDSVSSVIYTVDRELRITGVNREWDAFALTNGGEHLTGERILGRPLLDQMTGMPLERWRSVCQQILDGKLARHIEEIASEKPFIWRNFSLTASPLHDNRGQISGITFVATNITQLKKAEHEMFQRLIEIRGLRQVAYTAGSWTERRKVYKQITSDIAHLFSAEKCVIFLWDEQSGNLQAQEPAFGLAGRKLAELSLDMGHPADPDSLWTDMEEKDFILLNEGDEAPADMVETSARVDRLAAMMAFLRVSGRIHGAILVAGCERPFSQQDAQLLALFAIPIALSIENTELNHQLLDRTQQLAVTRDELNRMVKVKEAIRMPLTVVRGYLELLLEGVQGPMPDEQTAMMNMVLDKTKAIVTLVNRISPARFPSDATRYEHIYLAALVRQVLTERTADVEQAGLECVSELPAPDDEDSLIVGDPDLLSKALDGLLDNAIKLSPSGKAVRVSLQTSNEVVYVKIADSGPGIPSERLLHVWKPQKRPSRPGPANLTEVKRIIEGHGGQVWAESKPGQGSAFYVALRKLGSDQELN